ncbi:MAG: Propanediol utilization protein [Acidobacteria bacterium]|nr:Propanediol utilization protein [Acidobacteriota bacterium]
MAREAGPVVSRALVEQIVREAVTSRLGDLAGDVPSRLVVQASSRHMHLSREHLDVLFGAGYELTPERPLYQSQIELAFTDAIGLGFDDVPVRLSGDIAGTPGAYVMGPKGMVELKEGLIRAAIHVHMNPDEARYYGVEQGDVMQLRVGGDAGVVFSRVHVRIDPRARLNVHMDTDEANACALHLAREMDLFTEKRGKR